MFFLPFLLHNENKFLHLYRLPFDTGDDGSPISFAAGIFYVLSLCYITYRFRPPCGVLMHPLPVSGGSQRESGTFSCTLSRIN